MNGGRGGRGDDGAPDDDDANVGNKDNNNLSSDRQRAEGGEGNVDDGIDDEHVKGRVWRIPGRMDDSGDCDVEEGGSHPTTPQTTVTHELAERLRFAGRDWQRAEEEEGNVNDDGNN